MFVYSVVLCCVLAFAAGTNVRQCPDHKEINGLSDAIQLTPCKKEPCVLKKGTQEHIVIKFTPGNDTDVVNNKVFAKILGLDLPFIGVHGVSACDKLETESGEKASCPLTANKTYVYRDSFPIQPFYPDISTTVHWAIETEKHDDLICFEIDVKIKP